VTGTDHMHFDGDLMTFNMFIASVYVYTHTTASVNFAFCIRPNNETCHFFIAVNYHKF